MEGLGTQTAMVIPTMETLLLSKYVTIYKGMYEDLVGVYD